ncbi:MAG: hypothetical protein K6F94_04630 [Bacteroidaceae bacterium]|nr:hypothetical protein [Bacteroidaceae bacterium]
MKKIKLFLAAFAAMISLGVNAQTWTGNDVAEGSFYFYNIGTGKWLSTGNNWGTQASVLEAGGFCSTLELSDGKYAIKNTETRTNKKTAGPGYLGTNGFMDGESATYFTFTAASREDGVKAYYIQNETNNLAYTGTGTTVGFSTETGDNAQWVLVTKQNRLDAMAAATEANPVDATFLLKNPEFGRYKLNFDSWVWTFPGTQNKNNAGDNTNFCVESFHAAFDFCQTVADAPAGYYAVRGQAFYRQDGSDTENLPYFYVGDETVAFPALTGTENSMSLASTSFLAGNYQTEWSEKFACTDGLTVGAHLNTNTALWCIWDNIQIQYYGPVTDLSAYQKALANAVSAAQAVEGSVPAACYTAINAVVTEYNKEYSTADEYTTATSAINTAVSTYASTAIVANYNRYNTIKTAALAINPSLGVSSADAAAAAATTADEVTSAVNTVRYVFVSAIGEVEVPEDPGYIDVTAVMVDNASVSTNTDYWTAVENGSAKTSGSWGVCNYGECEFYNNNFKFYQTLGLNVGTWEFGVTGFHRAGNHSTYFYAGDDKILIPGVASSVVNSMAEAKTYFDAGNGQVSLKFIVEENSDIEIGIDNTDTETDKWTIFRNFTLKYYGAPDYSIYIEQWNEAVEDAEAAKMNYPNVTGDELTALNNAIEDAPDGSSKANYLAKIQALQTATNTFTAAAPSYDKYAAYRAETVALFGEELAAEAVPEEPTSAAEAATAVQNLNVAQYNKVTDEYTFSLNGLIGDFGSWTATATVAGEAATANYLTNEHWSGTTHAYYEQAAAGWGNANGWTIKYEKKCTLPAGNYVLKVAARSSAGTTSLVSCTATETEISLPNVGAASRGITDNGVASWDDSYTYANDNTGFGWQWRFLPFTLDEETEVTMTFNAEASTQYQWMSIADAELLSDASKGKDVAYDENENNTIENVAVANVTITREIILDYNSVVLPFSLTANQVAQAFGTGSAVYNYSETKISDTESEINFTAGDGSITANVPVLVKATAQSNEQYFEGVKIVAAESAEVEGSNFNYTGWYKPVSLSLGDYYYDSFYQSYYGGPQMSQGTGDIWANAFQAYFKDVNPEAGTKTVTVKIDGIATGIATIEKGKLNILEGAIYNAAGQRLSKLQKGVNIVNGKKYIVK